ncbi:TetR/AcrR family transcriptional regulator [Actinocatenispora rupis]|uniref:TetR family transcriptional regulator n=1 Tax=Actinocatenispora rupis TaxID=519421 RepID=A0A8J3JD54_9ACTN|nr:TetR family transcriptional regulator [Actinocatenispora rupis]GID16156.1 TetR family transcriptional regulator [Actinocatenispora rupis]
MSDEPGLRERKKRATRQQISDLASGLFLERGFDQVTVAEVARAADVSTKTVFNYFPRKEDLFLDRLAPLGEMITTAVRDRPAGSSVLRALRDMYLALLKAKNPVSGYAEPRYASFWRTVTASAALRARVREVVQDLEDLVARLYAEAEGIDPHGLRARLAGAYVLAAHRSVYLTAATRAMAGTDPDTITAGSVRAYHQAFDAAERALATLD